MLRTRKVNKVRLYLLRHGIAEDYSESGLDYDRKLTNEGEDLIKGQTMVMNKLGVQPDQIVSSPYLRSAETASIVAKHLEHLVPVTHNEQVGCGFRLGEFQTIVETYRQSRSLMIVGHNPDLPVIASQLIGGGNIDLKKGGLIRIEMDFADIGGGVLEWAFTAKAMLAFRE